MANPPAAAAAADLSANLWATVPLFYGADARKREDLDAEEFLERMIALINAKNAAAGDAEKINATTANFRGQARVWWTKSLPFSEDEATVNNLKTDWAAFRARFIKEYYPFSSHTDATINWVSFTQMPNESVYLFTQRVNNAASKFADLLKLPGEENSPADYENAAGAGLTFLNTATVAQKTNVLATFQAVKLRFRNEYARRYTASVVLKVVLHGLKDLRLKPVIFKSITDGDAIAVTMAKIKTAESQLPRPGTYRGSVHAIDGDLLTDPLETLTLAPIAAKGKGRGKGKPLRTRSAGRPGAAAAANRDNSKSCSFCFRPGHTESECFTKRRASEAQKQARTMDKYSHPPSSGTAGITTEPPHTAAISASPAMEPKDPLNGMLTM